MIAVLRIFLWSGGCVYDAIYIAVFDMIDLLDPLHLKQNPEILCYYKKGGVAYFLFNPKKYLRNIKSQQK